MRCRTGRASLSYPFRITWRNRLAPSSAYVGCALCCRSDPRRPASACSRCRRLIEMSNQSKLSLTLPLVVERTLSTHTHERVRCGRSAAQRRALAAPFARGALPIVPALVACAPGPAAKYLAGAFSVSTCLTVAPKWRTSTPGLGSHRGLISIPSRSQLIYPGTTRPKGWHANRGRPVFTQSGLVTIETHSP